MVDFKKLNLIGRAPAFLNALHLIEKCASCDATVLIEGETGTGKEVAARAIHYLSERKGYPFIPVNCGALPDSLVENELFGHVKGAYTDARDSQRGVVAHAEGGTLFLDEIEALSQKGQVVLLRFLQDKSYRPLGAKSQTIGDVRVLVASNKDLAHFNKDIGHLVNSGVLREDLFYRLTILSLKMPPLRQRPGDSVLLAQYFVRRLAREYRRSEPGLGDSSIEFLSNYSWPGNVRELENWVQRAFLMSEGSQLQFDQSGLQEKPRDRSSSGLGANISLEMGFQRAKAVVVAEFEKTMLVHALAESHGNVSAAARLLQKERRAVGKLMRKHGIDKSVFS
jgi:DNA-binding NtrC family response regulator